MALRDWQPSDMVGVTGIEYFDSTKNVVAPAMLENEWPVSRITAVNNNSGATASIAAAVRDDYRPRIGTLNGRQTIYFDGNVRQMPIENTANLPKGPGDKFWFGHFHVEETRNGDYYPLGYGGGNGTGIAYKLRVGSRFTIDVGNFGFEVGTTALTGPVSFVHVYQQSGTRSRAWLNAEAAPTVYTANALNTSGSNARLGSWPQYGNHSKHHHRIWGYGYGTPTDDDAVRLRAWLSWESGENGANLAANDPYKNQRPKIDDGTGGGNVVNADAAITESNDALTSASAVRITATAALLEQDDVVASATTAKVNGAALLVEDADILTAVAAALIRASLTAVEADDAIEVSAAVQIHATAALVERDDVVASRTIARITLDAALVEEDDQVEAMIGQVQVFYAEIAEQDDTLAADAKAIVRATARLIEGDDALVSRGYVGVTGDASLVEQDDMMASAGVVRINGAADLVEANDTLSARITNTLQLRAVIREQDDVLDAGVSIRVTLVADLVEADDQLEAYSGGPVEFDAAIVEDDDRVVAAGRVRVRARARMTEQPDTLSASWTIPVYAPPSRTALIEDTGPRSAVLADTGARSVIV